MEPKFWHERWQENRIGFHKTEANPIIVNHFAKLGLAKGAQVLVPLCGKSLDIGWLASEGYRVVGAELSPIAVAELIDQLSQQVGEAPTITDIGTLKRHSFPGVDIYLGNIFDLTKDILAQSAIPAIDAIYDRAALVALPLDIRSRYASHLRTLTGTAPQLLSCFEYDTNLLDGPPFAITEQGIADQYASAYTITELDRQAYEGKLKGTDHPATETVWHLVPKQP